MDNQRSSRQPEAGPQDLRTGMPAPGDRVLEAIRETETKLLQAFNYFAEINNKRLLQSNDVNDCDLQSRVEAVDCRVTEIEQRLNMPPQQ